MSSNQPLQAQILYANLMEEIKIRIGAIDMGTSNQLLIIPPFVREFRFLQIRMCCELIALACLAAHGDIPAVNTKKLHKHWQADKIIEALTALHPDFYPYPMQQGRNAVGHTLTAIDPNPLPKKELLRLYHKCGEVVHRGSMQKILAGNIPSQIHYPEITSLAQKINDLLNVHAIFRRDGKTGFICVLRNANDSMRVQVATVERRELPLHLAEKAGHDSLV